MMRFHKARSFLAAATILMAALATTSAVLVSGSATAGATTTPQQTGPYACGPVGGSNVFCLIYGVTASGIGPMQVSTPAVSDAFSGWYLGSGGWIQGTAGYVWIPYYSSATLLTGVVAGTAEQVSSWPYSNNFTLIF